MGLFNQFPFTNFHEMNLDWIINEIKKLKETINTIAPANTAPLFDTYESAREASLPIGAVFTIKSFDENRPYAGMYSVTTRRTPLQYNGLFAIPVDMTADSFGAYPDGLRDNKPLFQSMIDIGLPILLSANSTYYVSAPIDATNKAVFINGASTMIYQSDSVNNNSILYAPEGLLICNNINHIAVPVSSSCYIGGVEICGVLKRYGTASESYFADCLKQTVLVNSIIRGFAGLVKNDGHIVQINNCLILENTVGINGAIYDFVIDGCYCVGNTNGGIVLNGGSTGVIANTKSEFNNVKPGFVLENCIDVRITNCTADNTNFDLQLTQSKRICISGFVSKECKNGSSLYDCENVTIDGTYVRSSVNNEVWPVNHAITCDMCNNVNINISFEDVTGDSVFGTVLFTNTCSSCVSRIRGGAQSGSDIASAGAVTITSGTAAKITLPAYVNAVNTYNNAVYACLLQISFEGGGAVVAVDKTAFRVINESGCNVTDAKLVNNTCTFTLTGYSGPAMVSVK